MYRSATELIHIGQKLDGIVADWYIRSVLVKNQTEPFGSISCFCQHVWSFPRSVRQGKAEAPFEDFPTGGSFV